MEIIKVLVVDDEQSWIEEITQYLEKAANIVVVGAVNSKEQALNLFPYLDVHIVVMDSMLTKGIYDGIETLIEMLQIKPSKVIMLTSVDDQRIIIDSFKVGAINFINKKDFRDLPDAIRDAHNDRSAIHPSAAKTLRLELSRLKIQEEKSILTKSEFEILKLISTGYTQQDIESHLFISRNTVKNHISNILRKLNVKRSKDAIDIAHKKRWL
jgi:two-component system, NarL family, response regulator DevR